MSWTKRQLINDAFAEISMANWEFDLDPEDHEYALRKMDAMVASWGSAAIRINYKLSSNPDDSSLDQDSGLQQAAIKCVVTNAALEIAPKYGKTPKQSTVIAANDSLSKLLSKCSELPRMQFGKDLPRGAGNKPWRNLTGTYYQPQDYITAGQDGPLDI